MLRANTHAVSPELQELVEHILDEESRARINERRDASRQSITRPIIIEPRDIPGRTVNALTRDISGQGIGVISAERFQPRVMARVFISRIGAPPSIVLAECRWCDDYQHGWYLSGWNFVAVQRG